MSASMNLERLGQAPGGSNKRGQADGQHDEPPPPVGRGGRSRLRNTGCTQGVTVRVLAHAVEYATAAANRGGAPPNGRIGLIMANRLEAPLAAWYAASARDLPWRRPGVGAWPILV